MTWVFQYNLVNSAEKNRVIKPDNGGFVNEYCGNRKKNKQAFWFELLRVLASGEDTCRFQPTCLTRTIYHSGDICSETGSTDHGCAAAGTEGVFSFETGKIAGVDILQSRSQAYIPGSFQC